MDNLQINFSNIYLDLYLHRARVGDKRLRVSGYEFILLEYFMLNANREISYDEISEQIFERPYFANTNVINVNISRLRIKLREAGAEVAIDKVRRGGYVMKQMSEILVQHQENELV